jgi:Terminase large subunit, T4likevirus-type, N-terminal
MVRERLLMAANQFGKSFAGGMEAAMHATGIYPSWWQGRRFEEPTIGWVCGQTNEQVRDVAQRVLVGRPGSLGTGALPKESILEVVSGREPDGPNRSRRNLAPLILRRRSDAL